MAKLAVKLAAAVGRRWGYGPVANQAQDVATVVDLFDRILSTVGGTSDIPGTWPTDANILVAGLAELIGVFQQMHGLPVVDSVIDPFGKTLMLLNQLAVDPPVTPFMSGFGNSFEIDMISRSKVIADPPSLPGNAPLKPVSVPVNYSRRLVGVMGSSIKWYGVVLPTHVGSDVATAQPHIFFTPTPEQGGYLDGNYDNFAGWAGLWDSYTTSIGGQLSASGVNQVLVIPFYKMSQKFDLGIFLNHWQDVVSKVVTIAVNDINPYYLPGPFTFQTIVTSSFSNGAAAHRNFHDKGAGVANMTTVLFDLDGQASTEGANWQPAGAVTYRNLFPGGANPVGSKFFVGLRWGDFDKAGINAVNRSHGACSAFLLTHGLSTASW